MGRDVASLEPVEQAGLEIAADDATDAAFTFRVRPDHEDRFARYVSVLDGGRQLGPLASDAGPFHAAPLKRRAATSLRAFPTRSDARASI